MRTRSAQCGHFKSAVQCLVIISVYCLRLLFAFTMCDDVNDPPALLSSVCEVEFPPPLCAVASPVGSALCSCSSSSYNSLFLDSPSPLLTSNRKQFQIGTFRLAVCLFYIFPFSHKHQIQGWKLLHSLSHTKLLFYGYKTIQIPYINLNKLVNNMILSY